MLNKNAKHAIALAIVGLSAFAGSAQAALWVGTLNTTTAANNVFAGNPGEPAAPSATGGDGILQNVTGIDWHANGAGLVRGFDLGGTGHSVGQTDVFTLDTQFFAGSIASSSLTPDLRVAAPGPAIGTYEYTALAHLTETAIVTGVDGTGQVTGLTILTTGGDFHIFFDTAPDANQAAGTGFGATATSIEIITGAITGGLSTFTASGPVPNPGVIGVGGGTVFGTVSAVNNTYVNPTMIGTEVGTTLNFPGQTGTFTRAAIVNGIVAGPNTATNFELQTDAFQSFSVPEPDSIALFGIGLVGLAFRSQAKKKSEVFQA